MTGEASPPGERVRPAEAIAALCLATDLGMRLPFEHGLHSTLIAMRLGERLVAQVARRLPRAVGGHQRHLAALCEVAEMLTDRLGLPASLQALWVHLAERWDGKGEPGRAKGDEIPLPLRIAHVARDAAFQCLLVARSLHRRQPFPGRLEEHV